MFAVLVVLPLLAGCFLDARVRAGGATVHADRGRQQAAG